MDSAKTTYYFQQLLDKALAEAGLLATDKTAWDNQKLNKLREAIKAQMLLVLTPVFEKDQAVFYNLCHYFMGDKELFPLQKDLEKFTDLQKYADSLKGTTSPFTLSNAALKDILTGKSNIPTIKIKTKNLLAIAYATCETFEEYCRKEAKKEAETNKQARQREQKENTTQLTEQNNVDKDKDDEPPFVIFLTKEEENQKQVPPNQTPSVHFVHKNTQQVFASKNKFWAAAGVVLLLTCVGVFALFAIPKTTPNLPHADTLFIHPPESLAMESKTETQHTDLANIEQVPPPQDRFQFNIIHTACEKDNNGFPILALTLQNNSSQALIPLGVTIEKDCTRGDTDKIDEQTFEINPLNDEVWELEVPSPCVERGIYKYKLKTSPKKGINPKGTATLRIKLFGIDKKTGKKVIPTEAPIFEAFVFTNKDKMTAKSAEFYYRNGVCEVR